MKFIPILAFLASGILLSTSCSKISSTALSEDDSASGAIAGIIGGALSNSTSSGSLTLKKDAEFLNPTISRGLASFVPPALADTTCPSFAIPGSSCVASNNHLWLNYQACSFLNSTAKWTGTQLLQVSAGTTTCGTFPLPGALGTLVRQFVSGPSSLTPATATRTSASGSTVTLDDSTVNLGNFDGQTITPVANGGYGTLVVFGNDNTRSSLTIARRIYSTGRFDLSINGNLSIFETDPTASSRSVSGTILVYHNLLRLRASSVFNQVTHQNNCCVPVSGTITTTFNAGNTQPSNLGSQLLGKSEVLTFTGCGTATLQSASGATTNVSLGSCF